MKPLSPERLVLLLAEDDEADVVLTRRALNQLGILERLIWMPDGERTVDYLKGEAGFSDREMWPIPTILVLDQSMPGASGIEVLQWVRSQSDLAHLPVVILTGGLPPGQAELPAQLHAAVCAKATNAKERSEILVDAVCSAVRLAWFASLESVESARLSSAPAGGAPSPGRLPALCERQTNGVPFWTIFGV